MAYKYKPSKAVMSRFKVTKTGKLKRRHCKTSHLMSARSSETKRRLGRPALVFEGAARNMREFMGVSGLRPAKIAHERALRAKREAEAAEQPAAETK